MYTDNAEFIWKIIHFIMHSMIMYIVGQMSYNYFGQQKYRAQAICFMLLCNQEIREINQDLFNDTILALYVIGTMYLVQTNRPIIAALLLTLAISIKAGALLVVPSLLGWTQYKYGTQTLIVSCFIIVSFQILVALPFTEPEYA